MIEFFKPNKSKFMLSLLILSLLFISIILQAIASGYLKPYLSKEYKQLMATEKYRELKQAYEKNNWYETDRRRRIKPIIFQVCGNRNNTFFYFCSSNIVLRSLFYLQKMENNQLIATGCIGPQKVNDLDFGKFIILTYIGKAHIF